MRHEQSANDRLHNKKGDDVSVKNPITGNKEGNSLVLERYGERFQI